MKILDKINSPYDVKVLDADKIPALCSEIRSFLVESVSKTGGHLASNLGIVELTVAIHRVFDTSRDRLVFDVGHQSYVHKMLTGRLNEFEKLRQLGGISGFPKPCESVHDAFIAGHASNSISVALGMARARTLTGGDYSVIALIGDGALTGGLAYEGLSNAGESGEPLLIILNDNGMSIMPNVGGMAKYLSRERMKHSYASFKDRYRRFMGKIPGGKGIYRFTHGVKSAVKEAILHCSMFEEMGLQYAGPVDGYDVAHLEEALRWAKMQNRPTLIHVITKKGKGYSFAEATPGAYHGVDPFDPKLGVQEAGKKGFSAAFGDAMCELAGEDSRVCGITAAMTNGTGLYGFSTKFPSRFFDVGIAEGHAAAMAGGMASQGLIPVFAVYSTFLQRSYDMLMHDVALSGLHAVFAIDRAGIVGSDGETHQGIFDVSYLSTVPGMTVFSPSSCSELRDMLRRAVLETTGPVAVRYPRGCEGEYTDGGAEDIKLLSEGADVTFVTYGITVNDVLSAEKVMSSSGISADTFKLGCISSFDCELIASSVRKTGFLVVAEETIENGCVGHRIVSKLASMGVSGYKLLLKNLGNGFIRHGTQTELRKLCGIDGESIAESVMEILNRGKTEA